MNKSHIACRLTWMVMFLLAVAGAQLVSSFAAACDTPVYRFSMYSRRWAPWSYVAFYLYPGQEAAADAEANEKLKKWIAEKQEHTNLLFQAVNAAEAASLQQLPSCVRRAWQSRKDKSQSLHVVVSPTATQPAAQEVFAGRLQAADVASLVDSPARREMASSLAQGHLVLILLKGKQADQNAAAEKTIREVMESINTGKIDLERSIQPESLLPARPAASAGGEKVRRLKAALLTVSRADPRETWLVRMLQRVDADLDPLSDQPMAFWIYGRGRALSPTVGQGITQEHLLEDVQLLVGPCTCEIKEQNPGADLLTTTDWEAAALQMARIFGEEAGNEDLDVTSLVPRLDLTPPQPTTAQAADQDPGMPRDPSVDEAPATPQEVPNPVIESGGRKVMRYVGIALGCALLLLMAASLPFLRRGNCGG
jgi:hypothetical protein